MNAILLQNLPNFHGMAFKDPNAFLFELNFYAEVMIIQLTLKN